MTRWVMLADLGRCVGCQTCTAACKHANATSPAVQWRKVLDVESGEFPDVKRTFVPVGCMHCADPPCMHVCPSTSTRQRPDGIVTIDYDLCIGCAYCAVACPYQARYKVDRPRFAYAGTQLRSEAVREDARRIGVAQKCTFCSERIDFGLANGLTPGVHPDATPACVNSCIADALHFGDLDDPQGNVATLLGTHRHFAMHEEIGTGPGFHYLWAPADGSDDPPAEGRAPLPTDDGIVSPGMAPRLQTHWDWRAAANFMCGGAGTGLLAFAAAAAALGASFTPWGLTALAFVAAGLVCVWLEIGRPWRFVNVLFNPRTSWMSREAWVAAPLFASGLAAAWLESAALAVLAAALGLVFLYCQARMVHAAKGVPAWREPHVVPLLIATGLTEGAGLFVAGAAFAGDAAGRLAPFALAALVLIAARAGLFVRYRQALEKGAPRKSVRSLTRLQAPLMLGGHALPAAFLVAGLAMPEATEPALVLGGLLAFLGGWTFKFTLITRAAYNQGFAIERTPMRGAGGGGEGIKPGWSIS